MTSTCALRSLEALKVASSPLTMLIAGAGHRQFHLPAPAPGVAQLLSSLVLLILTYLVTLADSGVLVLNTIISGGRAHYSAFLCIFRGSC
ncbi:hypothetical protein ACJ7V3_16310 [Halomonas elongata]|uniref:hypothetical protein n=1 Tax=Halomonas elongata TaxID=2746 RepID=UPI0038D3DF42